MKNTVLKFNEKPSLTANDFFNLFCIVAVVTLSIRIF